MSNNIQRLLKQLREGNRISLRRIDDYEIAPFRGAVIPVPNGDGEIVGFYLAFTHMGSIRTIKNTEIIDIRLGTDEDVAGDDGEGRAWIVRYRNSEGGELAEPFAFFDEAFECPLVRRSKSEAYWSNYPQHTY